MKPEDHILPADHQRERDTLGAALLSSAHARDLVRLAEADYFSLDSNRAVFSAIKYLHEDGNEAIDVLMVGAELERRGQLANIGGHAYLYDLPTGVVLAISQSKRVQRLRELAERRRLLRTADELLRRAQDPTVDINLTRKWLAESVEVAR